MSDKQKHLDMIEAIIERMARNSFQLKGWAMTLVTAVVAWASQATDKRFLVLAFMPVIGFWILDAFYLQQERKYKLLYSNVTQKKENEIDFNLDTAFVTGTAESMKCLGFFRCMFSVSEIWFYPLICVSMVVLAVVLKFF